MTSSDCSLCPIVLDDTEYIVADELQKAHPHLFKGCKSSRNLLKRTRPDGEPVVREGEYAFGLCKDGAWSEGSPAVKRAKLLLAKAWVDETTENMVTHTAQYADAPPLLHLTDEEKLRDDEGNVMEVETRGERRVNGVFFRVKDVGEKLGMDLKLSLLNPRASYVRGMDEDYVTFDRPTTINSYNRSRMVNRPSMFLTYKGLVRVLNVSQSPIARRFCTWAARILQIAQIGTEADRTILASEILGVDIKAVQQTLKKCPGQVSVVYLVALGTLGQLKSALGINNEGCEDDAIVAKWGRTDDFCRRLSDHQKDYGVIQGVRIGVLRYVMIDPVNLSDCETEVKHNFAFRNWIATTNGSEELASGESRQNIRTELVIIPKAALRQTERIYEALQRQYGAQYKEAAQRMKSLEEKLAHQRELLDSERRRWDEKFASQTELSQAKDTHMNEKLDLIKEAHNFKVAFLELKIRTMVT